MSVIVERHKRENKKLHQSFKKIGELMHEIISLFIKEACCKLSMTNLVHTLEIDQINIFKQSFREFARK